MKSVTRFIVLPLFVLFATLTAQADMFTEREPNNTFDTAQFLFTSDGLITVTGLQLGFGGGDSDFFRFYVQAGQNVTATYDPGAPPAGIDDINATFIRLFTPDGAQFASGQTGGTSSMRNPPPVSLSFTALETGFFGVSLVTGITCQCTPFGYTLTINGLSPTPIPEPATMLLLGTGLAGVAAKVRRRRKVSND